MYKQSKYSSVFYSPELVIYFNHGLFFAYVLFLVSFALQ